MLKDKATAWRLHSALDRVLWGRCGNAVGSSICRVPLGALHASCEDAV